MQPGWIVRKSKTRLGERGRHRFFPPLYINLAGCEVRGCYMVNEVVHKNSLLWVSDRLNGGSTVSAHTFWSIFLR